jgi:membrane associated rhomboid family serine protease
LPLSDRDYMRRSPPTRQYRRPGSGWGLGMSPVLAIIIANLILFVAVFVSGEGRYPLGEYHEIIIDRFTYYLGLIPFYVTSRPWTILTSMFVHGNFFHILFNMLTLYFFGTYLTRMVGQNRFILLYFIGGIAGNLLYVLIGEQFSIVVGASGAIYAIAGALVVMVPNIRVAFFGIVPMPLWVAILVVGVILSFLPGVAWQAHLGGLVVGLIAGYFFRKRLRQYYYR